jgi:hypothetical protein
MAMKVPDPVPVNIGAVWLAVAVEVIARNEAVPEP